MRPAVFLDRDGTVIEHVHHLHRPEDVALIPGAAEAVAALRDAGFLCVIVTNQSVVGRGLLDLTGLGKIHQVMRDQLEAADSGMDAIYFCTEVPTTRDQTVIEHPDRKPGPGMLRRAAADLQIDLARSFMIGDSLSDLCAGDNAGCRESLLVLTGYGDKTQRDLAGQYRAFATLREAAQAILAETEPYWPRQDSTR